MLHRAPHDHGIQPSPARASCPRGPPSRHISNHKMEKDTQPHPGHTTPTTLPASEFKESIQGYGCGGGPGGQSKTFQKSRTQVQNHIKNCPEKDACRSVPWPLARPQAASVPRRVAVSASCKCAPWARRGVPQKLAVSVPRMCRSQGFICFQRAHPGKRFVFLLSSTRDHSCCPGGRRAQQALQLGVMG